MLMGAHHAFLVVRAPFIHCIVLWIICNFVSVLRSQTLPQPQPQPLSQNAIALLESQALSKFKESLNPAIDQGTFLPDWNPFANPPPCVGNNSFWISVICHKDRVWGLNLQRMGLSGPLDLNPLMQLGNLRILSVYDNNFQGPLPNLGRLTTLRLVYFSNNSFSGNISDDAFLGMYGLRRLFLSNNAFTGRIPSSVATLNRLVELRLEGNRFEGRVPNLQQEHISVNVSNNQLEGPIPMKLMNLTADSFSGNKGLCGPPLDPCPDNLVGHLIAASNSNAWLIVVIVIVVVLLVLLLVIVIVVAACRKRTNMSSRVHDSSSHEISKKGDEILMSPVETKANPRASRKAVPEVGKLVFVRDDIDQFDLAELLRASAEVLGSGHFGSSYKALLPNGKPMVVKRFRHMNKMVRHDFHDHVMSMGKLTHPNVLPIVAYYYRREEKLFVLDYVIKGSLASKLHGNLKGKGLDWPTRLKIIQGVAKGLSYLHCNSDYIPPHGHLKSSNVLLNDSFEPLIMHYGLIPLMNQDQAQQIMLAYKSPDFGAKGSIAKKTDVWCFGILMLEILTGKFPTSSLAVGNDESNLESWVQEIASSLSKSNDVFDKDMGGIGNAEKEIRKLLKIGISCCQKDLDKRFDMEELVRKIGEVKS